MVGEGEWKFSKVHSEDGGSAVVRVLDIGVVVAP